MLFIHTLYPFTEPFTEEDDFEEPVCTNLNMNYCEEKATGCDNQWKCCSNGESTVSCQMDLDTATGTCGNNNICLGPVDENCCYKVFCNCTTTIETTTSLPMTTKPTRLSTASKQTTDTFEQTTDISDVSTMPHISSSVPEQKTDTQGRKTDHSIMSNHPTQPVDQPSNTSPSDGSPSPSNGTVIGSAKQ